MSALRLARGATGRKKILKFDGCYHGHADALLVGAGSGVATLGIPGSPGVPEEFVRLTVQAPYNDLAALEDAFRLHGAELACVIVEPVAGNMGCVPPERGFLEGLRELCDRARRAAGLRRGDDRLPRRLGRRAAALRGHARPHLPRQGGRRRPPGGGVWRAARADARDRAGRPGLPGGHALGQPARRRGRARDAAPARAARGL